MKSALPFLKRQYAMKLEILRAKSDILAVEKADGQN